MSQAPPRVGDPAPSFELVTVERQRVTLEDFRGRKTILIFFPNAFSKNCQAELCSLRDDFSTYRDLDAELVGISVDSPWALAAWARDQRYEFQLLSDFWPHGAAARSYGVFDDSKGSAKRGTFVLDSKGIVRWSVVQESSTIRDDSLYGDILRNLT